MDTEDYSTLKVEVVEKFGGHKHKGLYFKIAVSVVILLLCAILVVSAITLSKTRYRDCCPCTPTSEINKATCCPCFFDSNETSTGTNAATTLSAITTSKSTTTATSKSTTTAAAKSSTSSITQSVTSGINTLTGAPSYPSVCHSCPAQFVPNCNTLGSQFSSFLLNGSTALMYYDELQGAYYSMITPFPGLMPPSILTINKDTGMTLTPCSNSVNIIGVNYIDSTSTWITPYTVAAGLIYPCNFGYTEDCGANFYFVDSSSGTGCNVYIRSNPQWDMNEFINTWVGLQIMWDTTSCYLTLKFVMPQS